MNNTKAIIDFSGYTAAELGPKAQTIVAAFVRLNMRIRSRRPHDTQHGLIGATPASAESLILQ